MAPAELLTAMVSIAPVIDVFTKSISNIWFRNARISLEFGIVVTLIFVDDAPSTFEIEVRVVEDIEINHVR